MRISDWISYVCSSDLRLDEAVLAIRRRARTPTVRLATDFAFAAFGQMPRVPDFRRANPGVDVQIVASQSLAPGLEADADLAVLFGDGDDFARQFAGDPRLLIPERATAVCSRSEEHTSELQSLMPTP